MLYELNDIDKKEISKGNAKKIFFNGRAIKRGGGVKGRPLRTFFKIYFLICCPCKKRKFFAASRMLDVEFSNFFYS